MSRCVSEIFEYCAIARVGRNVNKPNSGALRCVLIQEMNHGH